MYVISVKHKYHFQKEFEWRYASLDSYGGSFSTYMPCWDSCEAHAITFKTAEEAEKWFKENAKYLFGRNNATILEGTLGIRKKVYKTVKELKIPISSRG